MPIVTTRPAHPQSDYEFLFQLFCSTREREMDSLLNWTEEQKAEFLKSQFKARQAHYVKNYPQSVCHVILSDKELAGSIWTDWSQGKLHILDFVLTPVFRGQGLGSQLLDQLSLECDRRDLVAEIATHTDNLAAQRLYQQFGFQEINRSDSHIFYRREPRSRTRSRSN